MALLLRQQITRIIEQAKSGTEVGVENQTESVHRGNRWVHWTVFLIPGQIVRADDGKHQLQLHLIG